MGIFVVMVVSDDIENDLRLVVTIFGTIWFIRERWIWLGQRVSFSYQFFSFLFLAREGQMPVVSWDWITTVTCRYPYITFVLNFSQVWALYCLVQFYHATKEELRSINPLAKFLTFKAVVFVTWWQGVIIAFIFSSGLAFRWFSKKAIFRGHVQSGLQDLLICMEVCVFFLHSFSFVAGWFFKL